MRRPMLGSPGERRHAAALILAVLGQQGRAGGGRRQHQQALQAWQPLQELCSLGRRQAQHARARALELRMSVLQRLCSDVKQQEAGRPQRGIYIYVRDWAARLGRACG